MTILFTAMVFAAAPTPAAVQPAAPATQAMHAQHSQHAQPAQPGAKAASDGCACCKGMAAGGKMACCAKHGESHGGGHDGHKANR